MNYLLEKENPSKMASFNLRNFFNVTISAKQNVLSGGKMGG